ncbi:MAG TPA: VapE domain-containing protein [Gemmatimonadaceae bacterium]|nr:VapE domain-containing protein [Gemmatimonadaceae bacterium]
MPASPIPAKLSRLGRAALHYATQYGWRVFPLHSADASGCSCARTECHGPGKHPRTQRGCLDATTDPAQVRAWWSQWPDANVGVATGAGLVVLDIDTRAGGDDTIVDLRRKLGDLPDTVECLTGGGGRHIYLAATGEVRNSAGALGPGVDVRGDGGYVVAPPSVHASGRAYAWEASSRPDEVDVEPVPPAWLEAMTARPKLRVIPGAKGEPFPEGERNASLFKRAASMRTAGFDASAILAALMVENDTRCVPPLDPAEVRGIAESAARYPAGLSPEYAARQAAKAEGLSAAQPANVASDEWRAELFTTKTGAVRNTFANLCTILRRAPEFATLRLNEMTRAPELNGARVTDAVLGTIRERVEREYGFGPGADATSQALVVVAAERAYSPVAQYLRGLVWDGVSRLDAVHGSILGGRASAVGEVMVRSWFISAVARALKPGCKVDTALVLVGGQGAGKSSFFRLLGGQWFGDSAVDLESKDAMAQINAAWIYELGELDHVTSRAHAGRIKAFVASQVDLYRAPYGRAVEPVPRSNVIVGSTNEAQFLNDPTGDRRFWCVEVGAIDLAALERDRDQLWAEAVAALDGGEGWWLTREAEAARDEAAEEHRLVDPWEEVVAAWLVELSPHELRDLTSRRILTGPLRLEIDRVTAREQQRLAAIMRRLGWRNRVLRVDGRNNRVWDVAEVDGTWRHRT